MEAGLSQFGPATLWAGPGDCNVTAGKPTDTGRTDSGSERCVCVSSFTFAKKLQHFGREASANPNAGISGVTPLMVAAASGQVEAPRDTKGPTHQFAVPSVHLSRAPCFESLSV